MKTAIACALTCVALMPTKASAETADFDTAVNAMSEKEWAAFQVECAELERVTLYQRTDPEPLRLCYRAEQARAKQRAVVWIYSKVAYIFTLFGL